MSVRDEVKVATLRVIATEGVQAVTIRRVAREVGRSTTAITHYFADRDQLLGEAVSESFAELQAQLESKLAESDDPVWAFLDWSIEADPGGVWIALVAATAAGIEPVVSEHVRVFEQWWDDRLIQLIADQSAPDPRFREVADAIGVVVDGMLLARDVPCSDASYRRRLLRMLVGPLLVPVGEGAGR